MAIEIERKFLVNKNSWTRPNEGTLYVQGYLSSSPETTVRIRIAGKIGFITIKGKTTGFSREEFEYEIPVEDAEILLKKCKNAPIKKIRYKVLLNGTLWEIDEFLEENNGLLMAEVELPDEKASFFRPEWLGKEVTDDKRYHNSHIAEHPFKTWE